MVTFAMLSCSNWLVLSEDTPKLAVSRVEWKLKREEKSRIKNRMKNEMELGD